MRLGLSLATNPKDSSFLVRAEGPAQPGDPLRYARVQVHADSASLCACSDICMRASLFPGLCHPSLLFRGLAVPGGDALSPCSPHLVLHSLLASRQRKSGVFRPIPDAFFLFFPRPAARSGPTSAAAPTTPRGCAPASTPTSDSPRPWPRLCRVGETLV